jgi:hypothetical protein
VATEDVKSLAEALEENALEFVPIEDDSYTKEGTLRMLHSLEKNHSVIYIALNLYWCGDIEINEAVKMTSTLIGIRSLQNQELAFSIEVMSILEENRFHFIQEVKLCLLRRIWQVSDFEISCVKIILEMANWKNVSIPIQPAIKP